MKRSTAPVIMPALVPVATTRTTLLTLTGPEAPRKISEESTRLEKLYEKKHQRRLPCEMYIASWGPLERTMLGLSVHARPEHAAAVEFLRQNVLNPATNRRAA